MPIILDTEHVEEAAESIKALASVSPAYFSKVLTGNGARKTGLLNCNLLPAKDAATATTSPQPCNILKNSFSSADADYTFLPMEIVDFPATFEADWMPDDAECVSDANVAVGSRIFIYTFAKNVVLINKDKGTANHKKELYVMYNIFLIEEGANGKYKYHVFNEPCINHTQLIGFNSKFNIDGTILTDYIDNLTVYDTIAETAVLWNNNVFDIFRTMLDDGHFTEDDARAFALRLSNYSVSLMDYKKIYDYAVANKPSIVDRLTDNNLNILLNQTLEQLEGNKPNIHSFSAMAWDDAVKIIEAKAKAKGVTKNIPNLSREQIAAVTATGPCSIVQAGAGTGKSTVINNRLDYMDACGVDLSTVMVLSFTNAAADHIKEIAPAVNSKTIASMIHDIYSMNYTHALSTTDTMLNIMMSDKTINNRNNKVGLSFINALQKLRNQKEEKLNVSLTNISLLFRNHFDECIAIMDKINQTTLELEQIICYLAPNLKEPTACQHLIMDEVQDNSIFEFIYLVNYVVRHNASIYFVGDGSQTLFEFRASNPKALNSLEMSGVFDCMKLQTNYRSNQNILDFANVTLAKIEANQFAKIQLQANSFITNNFEDDVLVTYRQKASGDNMSDMLPSMVANIRHWIKDKLETKHEQIAFLAYQRKDIEVFEEIVKHVYPDKTLINITPEKTFNISYFSKYILAYGDDFVHKIGSDVTIEITRHIIDNARRLCNDSDEQVKIIQNNVGEWKNANQARFTAMDIRLATGAITMDEFIQAVFESLVDFEIDKNAMKSRIVSANNEKTKSADTNGYDFVVSTIHSAKGLEFDNVILLYDEKRKDNEADKRMYYVGLTRAQKAEVVLAYNSRVGSDILETYEAMVESKKNLATLQAVLAGDDDATVAVTTETSDPNASVPTEEVVNA